MRRTWIVLIVAFLILSCSDDNDYNQNKAVKKQEELTSSDLSLGSDFSPFFDKSKDSIVFVFSKRIAFDTSWILVFKKLEGGELYACYNQITPSYHRDVHDYLEDSSQLLVYEGLVFQFDNSSFNTVINNAGMNKFVSQETTPTTCIHCPYYTLYYNSQVYRSTKQNQALLDTIGKYLKSSILDSLLEKKRNPRW